MQRYRWTVLLHLGLFVFFATVAEASEDKTRSDASRSEVARKGLEFLKSSQADDGTFSIQAGPGITALAITAAIRNGEALDSPMVAKGLEALETFVKPDGGIYGSGRLRNYETCIAILCFVEANRGGKYNKLLADAKKFVVGNQYGSASDSTTDDVWDGGMGYGEKGRPDLSNTAFMIEALIALETAPNDPAIQSALEFVSRCQNLSSEHNTTQFASKIGDGSFFYTIPKDDFDPADDPERFSPDGGIYGYGTMTYAGYKSMLYAGVSEDDPRVVAANKWISNNYTVDMNPRMGSAGLYYYYQTFGKALSAAGVEKLTDSNGDDQDWRVDLLKALAKRQNGDGSWSNKNERWFENDKNLCTSFALLAIASSQPSQPKTKK
ncbi:MAG TPA: hypothetical protein DDW52_03260 [Planctomycetaceae bacterium]|nr:hypothetical protein [Planctomycetaceae bacterium]